MKEGISLSYTNMSKVEACNIKNFKTAGHARINENVDVGKEYDFSRGLLFGWNIRDTKRTVGGLFG